MRFDLSKEIDVIRLHEKVEYHIRRQTKKLELTEKRTERTINQNSLFHMWISVFAEDIGELNLDAVKRDVKRTLLGMREVRNRFTGEIQSDDYRTSEMDTKQLSEFMDKFKTWALSEFGCYLPYFGDAGYEEMINLCRKY